MEVYCLMTKYTHWRQFNTSEHLVAVCKNEKAVIRKANEYIRNMKRLSVIWGASGDFKNDEVTKEDLFRSIVGEDTFDYYVFQTEYFEDGHRRMEHSIYVWKQFIEE